MNLPSFIAQRYLRANHENRFFSWIAGLSIGGVAIGVAALIVVKSLINGFEFELRNRFLAANAHIIAFNFPGGLESPDVWADRITQDFRSDVNATSPFIHNITMVRKDSMMHSVLVRGIVPRQREQVNSLTKIVSPVNSLDLLQEEIDIENPSIKNKIQPGIILGTGLLSILDAKVGDMVSLISPEAGAIGEFKPFKIVGKYDSGLKHYDNQIAIISLTAAQKLFQLGERVIGIEIGLRNPRESLEVAERMRAKYSIQIKDWQSFNKPLFDAMKQEEVVIDSIVLLVSGVAGFNILTALFIAVTQKQRSISVLKALGASNGFIARVFLTQGFYVGAIGALLGNVLALIISAILERYQFINLPDLYLLANLPMSYDWRTYALVTLVALVIAVFSGLYPAYVAARIAPTEGLKGTRGFA